jgi:hypothetical protein
MDTFKIPILIFANVLIRDRQNPLFKELVLKQVDSRLQKTYVSRHGGKSKIVAMAEHCLFIE